MSSFPSIRIEGGLLGPDLLDQLLAGDLPGQRPADFGLDAKRSLTDEIAAVFADARALWGVFRNRLQRLPDSDLATGVTRDAWAIPFLGLLGYEPRYNSRAYEVDGLTFAISHRACCVSTSKKAAATDASDDEDAPPVHIVGLRQELGRLPASGRPRMAPHSLVQEYLNRTEHVWGLVTNGLTLRLLHDSTFVRRQAYVEFDLQAMIEEQRFQDFAAVYRLLHRSRLPRGVQDAGDSLLEQYYNHSVEQGGRVREHLRDGVEQCITLLANGFLRHPANDELRRRVSPSCTGNDRLTADSLYRQLLRLVYRFLFLLVSEDRGILGASPLYREHYGIGRLRRLLEQRPAYTEHDDLWRSLRVLWLVLIKEQPQPSLDNQPMSSALGLPVLNGELFDPQALDACTIANRDLLQALWQLAWYQESTASAPRRVNYAALDVEELGSVYESLLDFHPAVDPDTVGRPLFNLVSGSERKTTGSYYTPPQLVGELIKSALEPVLHERLAAVAEEPRESTRRAGRSPQTPTASRAQPQRASTVESQAAERPSPYAVASAPSRAEQALLSIHVCDPACGSGHFLLAAARRMGKELARIRSGDDEPAPERVREAIRDVISHCVYGVDKNPLAVDLCRVALWLESNTGDKPLTFLDHRIRCGDSLIGVFDLDMLREGIPDEAFQPLEGDDKATARELARRNRDERGGHRDLFAWNTGNSMSEFSRHSHEVDEIADDSAQAIRRKKRLFEDSHSDVTWSRQKQACDLWTAAFFQPLVPDTPAITSSCLAEHLTGRPVEQRLLASAGAISSRQRFFHWPLEFPEVLADGGFDVILSNPPWERVKLQEQEFFAARDARIATAANKAARAKLIRELPQVNPDLHREFVQAQRAAAGTSGFMRNGGRFPLAGRGDINTYAVFSELAATATAPNGRAGLIVPTGIGTDDTTKTFFSSLVTAGRLIDLTGFENEEFIFPAVHHAFKFCTISIAGSARPVQRSRIAFFIRRFSQLSESERFFLLEKADFFLLNPNTGNCPVFRTQADAELTKAIYRRVPVFGNETNAVEGWNPRIRRVFDMNKEEVVAACVQTCQTPGDGWLPMFEAKMLHQFDHRFSTYEGATDKQVNVGILPQPTAAQKRDPAFVIQPRYWVRADVVESAIPKYPESLALAVQLQHRQSIQRVLCWWAAGYYLNRGDRDAAVRLLHTANRFDLEKSVARCFDLDEIETACDNLQRLFPISASDVRLIVSQLDDPDNMANELVDRFSPKWLLAWRDITNSTNQRTVIATFVPRCGTDFTIRVAPNPWPVTQSIGLCANLNATVLDYCARQKVGGTHLADFITRQLPILSPDFPAKSQPWAGSGSVHGWIGPRVLELVYTANDMTPLAHDFGCDHQPFIWDEDRRFEIRCELDAAFFHLYLPCEPTGTWRPAEGESVEQLTTLQRHFPTPRDSLAYILDQFPITRQKDEKGHGRYRTKDRILEIYDALLTAQQSGKPYQTRLDPPPGDPRAAHPPTRTMI